MFKYETYNKMLLPQWSFYTRGEIFELKYPTTTWVVCFILQTLDKSYIDHTCIKVMV